MRMLKTLATVAGCVLAVAAASAQQLSHSPDTGFHDGFEGATAGPFNDADAARFLAQATFGPTATEIASRAMSFGARGNPVVRCGNLRLRCVLTPQLGLLEGRRCVK